jgi:DNA invertase Pin-like site-specific DNA recombinase
MEAAPSKYAHYLRVSTDKQGIDGYGIDAQRAAVRKYVPCIEFIEVESGKRKDRPELLKALDYCKKHKAILVVAKLDRLSRNVSFVATLQESRVKLICADMPEVTDLTIHIMAAMAQHEAKAVSDRTTAALKAAKARGVVLGKSMSIDKADKGHATQTEIANRNAEKVLDTVSSLRRGGSTLQGIASQLNGMGVSTPRGKQWTAQAVKNALGRQGR